MSGGSYRGRTADVYFDSDEELADLKAKAEASGCSVSSYIKEMIRKAESVNLDKPRPDLSKKLEEVKAENRELKRENLPAYSPIVI